MAIQKKEIRPRADGGYDVCSTQSLQTDAEILNYRDYLRREVANLAGSLNDAQAILAVLEVAGAQIEANPT